MRFLAKILPFLAAGSYLAALLEMSERPEAFPYAAAAIGISALATSGALSYLALFRGAALAPCVMPGLLAASSAFAFVFVENRPLRAGIAILTAFLYLTLVRHLAETVKFSNASTELKALSEWSALVSLFGLGGGLLAAVTFLDLNQWLAAGIFSVAAVYVSLALARLAPSADYALAAGAAVFLSEAFIAVMFLPFSHWVGAGIVSGLAYLLFSVIAAAPPRIVRRNIFWAAFVCLILAASARWR